MGQSRFRWPGCFQPLAPGDRPAWQPRARAPADAAGKATCDRTPRRADVHGHSAGTRSCQAVLRLRLRNAVGFPVSSQVCRRVYSNSSSPGKHPAPTGRCGFASGNCGGVFRPCALTWLSPGSTAAKRRERGSNIMAIFRHVARDFRRTVIGSRGWSKLADVSATARTQKGEVMRRSQLSMVLGLLHHPGRQRQQLVHQRRVQRRVDRLHGRPGVEPASGPRQRLRGGQHRAGSELT